VEKLLTDLISVIKQKLSSQQDPYLKKCLKNFLTALVQSYINLSEIQMLFDEYKKNLTNMFYAKIRNVDDCIANDNMFDGINQ
jgi:5'-deoxynucleotidase YfbR-like HD superfamily hydrolase